MKREPVTGMATRLTVQVVSLEVVARVAYVEIVSMDAYPHPLRMRIPFPVEHAEDWLGFVGRKVVCILAPTALLDGPLTSSDGSPAEGLPGLVDPAEPAVMADVLPEGVCAHENKPVMEECPF